MSAVAITLRSCRRTYTQLLDPREHPDDARRPVQPPSWETLGNRPRFTGLRSLPVQDNRITDYVEEIELYSRVHELGDILWPAYPILFAENLDEVLAEIRRRDLFLFDIWGYVPGSGPGGYWQQFEPPEGVFQLLESALGEGWLGMDVGEQDGRYIGGYAGQMHPRSAGRLEQYLNFQRHFQRFCDDLGNRMCTLVSLNFGHYFLKEGVYSLIGAETAQALPNGQVYYAFIRGAGKQYGVPWFGNASVYNRWGFKSYAATGDDHGPTKGTSLNLMKRLLVSHLLYNCVLVGFEAGWLVGDKLSPIGRLQQETGKWVKLHGQPGVMQTPVALMLDFFCGWSFPRHLYSSSIYRVWGNLPYGPGDYLTDGLLDMLYPGYQDASYCHDESGFITPTPYGDMADCLLSDAEGWLLERYPVLVLAGDLAGGLELRDKLEAYVQQGGLLVITAGNLARLPHGIAGVQVGSERRSQASTLEVRFGDTIVQEEQAFELMALDVPENAAVVATCGDAPVVVKIAAGKGQVIALAGPFGLPADTAHDAPVVSEVDQPLPRPYPLLEHVRLVLDGVFRGQMLFDAGAGLSWITCRRRAGEYTLGICNNALRKQPLEIRSLCGPIQSIEEMPLAQSEKQAVGYLPEGFEQAHVGASGHNTIAGGDVRVFAVQVAEEGVEEIRHRPPPRRPGGRILPLSGVGSIQSALLARPTFSEHFAGVLVDWRYLHEREARALSGECGWLQRQQVRVLVDLSSGINLYPNLRLIDNVAGDYSASIEVIEDVLRKMECIPAADLLLSLHRLPENNFSAEETWDSFTKTLRTLCEAAAQRSIAVYLRLGPDKPPATLHQAVDFVQRVDADNISLAPSLAWLQTQQTAAEEITAASASIGLWLASSPRFDLSGHLWDNHGPLALDEGRPWLRDHLATVPEAPVVLDALYPDWDAVYRDVKILQAVGR
jgi:hypothetical protein